MSTCGHVQVNNCEAVMQTYQHAHANFVEKYFLKMKNKIIFRDWQKLLSSL